MNRDTSLVTNGSVNGLCVVLPIKAWMDLIMNQKMTVHRAVKKAINLTPGLVLCCECRDSGLIWMLLALSDT